MTLLVLSNIPRHTSPISDIYDTPRRPGQGALHREAETVSSSVSSPTGLSIRVPCSGETNGQVSLFSGMYVVDLVIVTPAESSATVAPICGARHQGESRVTVPSLDSAHCLTVRLCQHTGREWRLQTAEQLGEDQPIRPLDCFLYSVRIFPEGVSSHILINESYGPGPANRAGSFHTRDLDYALQPGDGSSSPRGRLGDDGAHSVDRSFQMSVTRW